MALGVSTATFASMLAEHARERADAPALRIRRGERVEALSYSALWRQALAAGGFLRALAVKPDERIALFAEDSPRWVAAWLGIHFAGAVVVPLDVQFSVRELRTVLRAARCRLLLHSSATATAALAALAETDLRQIIPIDGDAPAFRHAPLAAPLDRGPDDLLTLIFTSGTTGDPKGVRLSVGNISSNVQAILKLGIVTRDDAVLCILPLHHCYALTTSVLAALAVGASITFCPSLRGPDIVAAMNEAGITVMPGVPKLFEAFDRAIAERLRQGSPLKRRAFHWLARLARFIRRTTGRNVARLLFPSIRRSFGPRFRFFCSGGAKLDAAVMERLLDVGIKVIEGYGLTETSPVVTFNPVDAPRPGSVGIPLAGVEVRIDRPDARGVGEVLVRGPNVMQGYENRPAETAEVLRDGWFHTGDLGYFDPHGYLFLTGRIKEVIVMPSGKNVYPEDVERCYSESPLIKEICVLPVETPDGRVERLQAVIVPALDELQRRQATSIADAIRLDVIHFSQTMPSHMRVTDLRLVTGDLPRTRLGKLRRAEVRRLIGETAAQAGGAEADMDEAAALAVPGAERLLERLRQFSGRSEVVRPSDHLEIDLGLDSLARVELEVILEKEFGLTLTPEEASRLGTAGDLIKRLSGGAPGASGKADWGLMLSETVAPPLTELFHLAGHGIERRFVECVRRLGFHFCRVLFRLDVQGLEHLPAPGAYVLCPTHASFIDAPLVSMSLPRAHVASLFFLGAREFFRSPLMRWVARAARVILSGTSDTVLVSLRRAAEALRGGRSVCIFPEGSITRDGRLQRPHPGAGILACELGVPIVPVLLRGTHDTLSYAHPRLRRTPLGLTVGRPVQPPARARHGNEDYAAMMRAWQDEIARLRREDDAAQTPTAGRSPRVP